MKVIYNILKCRQRFKNPVVAIGVFDGLHIGHQQLIRQAVRRAKAINGQAVVMTFHPHPVHVLNPKIFLPSITSLGFRLGLIESLGAAGCVVIKFTKEFSKLPPEKFVKRYLVDALKAKEIFVGDDFRFGKGREGGLELMVSLSRQNGFRVNALHQIKGGRKKIGSTRIRQLILDGKLEQASKYLGRPFLISGKVVKGKSRGKEIGFPTANIFPDSGQILPSFGAYATRVQIGQKEFNAMTNVGLRPSVSKNTEKKVNIETHIFDYNRYLYGKEITVKFIKKIRDEKFFKTLKELGGQLKKDMLKAKGILKNIF